MGFPPQRASRRRRVDPGCTPPCPFVAVAVDFMMVASTKGDDELVADLAPKGERAEIAPTRHR